MTRKCTKCEVEKELTEENFRPHGKNHLGFRYACRECERKNSAQYSLDNPGKKAASARRWVSEHLEQHAATKRAWRLNNPEKHRSARLKWTYGITLEEYNKLLSDQNGGCAICGAKEADSIGRKLHVDHDHVSDRVRGLLCRNCNTVLGAVQDRKDLLYMAIDYLSH